MLSYALGRGLVDSDYATIEQVVTRLEEHDYRAQELILGIVESVPFRYKPGTSPETAAGAGDSALLEP
jgi:hypothetical protein